MAHWSTPHSECGVICAGHIMHLVTTWLLPLHVCCHCLPLVTAAHAISCSDIRLLALHDHCTSSMQKAHHWHSCGDVHMHIPLLPGVFAGLPSSMVCTPLTCTSQPPLGWISARSTLWGSKENTQR